MDDPSEDDFPLLAQNDPCSDAWQEASFLGRLTEDCLFDEDGYAEVEDTLIRAMTEGPDFPTLGAIIRIIEQITLMLKRHVDSGDTYRIENLDYEQVAEFDRRVRFCLIEISLGNAPDLSLMGG